MTVALPPSLEELVRRKVVSGEFKSPGAVVCAALRLLEEQEGWKADARAKIEVGWQQAKSGELLDPEQVSERLAARKAAWHLARAGA